MHPTSGRSMSLESAQMVSGTGDPEDDALALLGPVAYYSWTNASPEQVARQAERCWRENIPGWRFEVIEDSALIRLREWNPDGKPC